MLFNNVSAGIAEPDVTYNANISFNWEPTDNCIVGTLNIGVSVPENFTTQLNYNLGMKASLMASDGTVYEHDFGVWYNAYTVFKSLTNEVQWRIPGAFATTTVICVIEIYSTTDSVAPGALQRTNIIKLPDTVAPDLSGMVINISRSSNFPDRAVTVSIGGTYNFGSGVLVTYAYQFKSTASNKWITFKRTQETHVDFVPAEYDITAGEAINFRVLVYSTTGRVVNSQASQTYTCDALPVIVPRTCIRFDNAQQHVMYMYVIVNGKMRPVIGYLRWFGPSAFFDADSLPFITADGQIFNCLRGAVSG